MTDLTMFSYVEQMVNTRIDFLRQNLSKRKFPVNKICKLIQQKSYIQSDFLQLCKYNKKKVDSPLD